jgi:hypothetical protein
MSGPRGSARGKRGGEEMARRLNKPMREAVACGEEWASVGEVGWIPKRRFKWN